jgi:hypothetical protein
LSISNVRNSSWRQGDIVSASDLCRLVESPRENDTTVGIVVSHDCDLAASAEKEPFVELISASVIKRLGQDSNAKTARRLHIQYATDAEPACYQLSANQKFFVPKAKLFELTPAPNSRLYAEGRRILQRWLAARYDRSAFPENFESRLRQRPTATGKSLVESIALALDDAGQHVRALLFDVDRGEECERTEMSDSYRLGIVVLYVGNPEDDIACEKAQEVVAKLEKLFDGIHGIVLDYCDAVSDAVLSVQEATQLKEWRLEYLSFRTQPIGPTMSS